MSDTSITCPPPCRPQDASAGTSCVCCASYPTARLTSISRDWASLTRLVTVPQAFRQRRCAYFYYNNRAAIGLACAQAVAMRTSPHKCCLQAQQLHRCAPSRHGGPSPPHSSSASITVACSYLARFLHHTPPSTSPRHTHPFTQSSY